MAEDNQQLELTRDPSPVGEADQFSTPDERAVEAEHKRRMADKASEQGPIGRWIGSSDSSLTICFVLLILGFVAIGISGFAMIWSDNAATVLERLITFELTVAGYVMGKMKSE